MKGSLEHVRSLAAKLKPFLGPRAEGLISAWIAEDADGRREIEQLLDLEYQRRFGADGRCDLPPPDEKLLPKDGVVAGHVLHLGQRLFDLKLPPEQLNRHVMIAGASGSGKTTLMYGLAKGLIERRIPFLLFDFALGFRPLTRLDKNIRVFTVGEEVSPFFHNPLVELIQHCQRHSELRDLSLLFQLSDVLCKTFFLGHGAKSILSAALANAARTWAQKDFAVDETPNFRTVLQWVREYQPKEAKGMRYSEWRVSAIRALEQLCTGSFGHALAANRDEHQPMSALKDQSVIFELNLPNDLKTFFVEMLLLAHRASALQDVKTAQRGHLKRMFLIDEAHHLLRKTDEKIESQLSLALREHRGLGTGYIIADQTPSQLDESAIANTFTKCFFQLDNRADILTASRSLLLERDDEQWLGKLPPGQCLVRFGAHDAFLVQVDPADDLKNQPVSDEEIAARHARFAGDSAKSSVETPPPAQPGLIPPPTRPDKELSEDEQKLLVQILKKGQAFAGISALFRGCSISTRKGQAARESLEQRGLVRSHEIHREIPGGGKTVILEITDQGAELLRQLGHDARDRYYGGRSPEHEYWKEQAAQHFAARGFTVAKEAPLPSGGAVDVQAVKDGQRIAIEVETGKSDPLANVQKALAAGFNEVKSLATRSDVASNIARSLELQGVTDPRVTVETVAALQPTAEEYLARFFQLPGAEKLLVLDVLDYPASSWQAREQRLAGAGVTVERTKIALDACLDHGLLQGDEDDLSLARATRDAFKVMGALRD